MDDLLQPYCGDQHPLATDAINHNHSPVTNRASGLSQTRPPKIPEESRHQQPDIEQDTTSKFNLPLEETKFRVGYSPFEYAGKKQLVLEELSQPGHQKRSVRSVWEALKSRGCHIKPDFVEKVMQHSKPAKVAGDILCDLDTDYDSVIGINTAASSGFRSEFAIGEPGHAQFNPSYAALHSRTSQGAAHVPNTASIQPAFHVPEDNFIKSERMSDNSLHEEFTNNQREHLTTVVSSLLTSLDEWCLLPSHHAAAEPSVMGTPGSSDIAVGGESLGLKSSSQKIKRPYLPDFAKTEEQVADEALVLALALQHALSPTNSPGIILKVAEQFREMRRKLQDIGMPKTCLAKVGLRDLQVCEVIARVYGRQEWVLRELWQCAADCVYELGMVGVVYARYRQSVANKAMEAARDLAYIRPNQPDSFLLATSFHYEAVSLLEAGQMGKAIDTLVHSLSLFGSELPRNKAYDQVREMKRAVLSYSRILGGAEAGAALTQRLTYPRAAPLPQILMHSLVATSDPVQAELLADIADATLEDLQDDDLQNLLDNALSCVTEAIRILRSFQSGWPTRIQPALAGALKAWAKGLRLQGRYPAARQALEEAITIQRRLTRFGDIDGVPSLVILMTAYVRNELHLQRWKDGLFTKHHSVTLIGMRFRCDLIPALHDSLDLFPHYLQFIRDPSALTVVRGLIDIVHPTGMARSRQASNLVSAVLRVMLAVSDLQRGMGAFDAALDTSREALIMARKSIGSDEMPSETYLDILICHAHSLVDNDRYEEASAHLKEVRLIWEQSPLLKRYYPSSWKSWAALFSLVRAQFHQTLSYIDEVIDASRAFTEYPSAFRTLPCWLCSASQFLDGGTTDALGWLLLIRTAVHYNRFRTEALNSAAESLALTDEYHKQARDEMEPYAQASVLGHKYILLCFLGQEELGKSVLKQSIAMYRSVFDTEPHTARLPLLVFLDIILVLSRGLLSLEFAIPNLRLWKKSVYQGSTSFFEHFVAFLQDLPRYLHVEVERKDSEITLPHTSLHEASSRVTQVAHSGITPISHQRVADQTTWLDSSEASSVEDAAAIGSFSISASHEAKPDVFVDLPGKTVHFINQHIGSPVSAKTPFHTTKFNPYMVPNLTGRIKIVKGPLCAGGFCDIYSGELMSERGTEPVAMKMLRVFNTEAHVVQAKKKFRREVSLWCSLRHRYVLPFFGTCEFDEFRLFMVSPWAEGGNSLEYLRRNPFADRGRLLSQTASALEYLHFGQDAPRVVHGDLKADNVLISAAGDALLCDFGLSRHVEEIVSKSGSSSAGRAGGHARFMAPELLLPPKDDTQTTRPTPESDVFAFASLMLQIFTEKLPFGDLLEAQAILKLANGDLPSRPVDPIVLERGCDHRVWTLMSDCWRFEPCKRPNMDEVTTRMTGIGRERSHTPDLC